MVNQIISALGKEGIFLHTIDAVFVAPQADAFSEAMQLKEALDRIDMAIGILTGLVEASS